MNGRAKLTLAALGLAALFASAGCNERHAEAGHAVPYTEIRALVNKHCISCHSEHPTNPAFPIAPNGTAFDTAEELHRHATKMKARTVGDRTMPLLNKTEMTDDERFKLAAWVDAGAEIP